MASRKEEEPEQFKVVDRRMFTAEGEPRPGAPPLPEPPAPATPEPEKPAPTPPPPPQEAPREATAPKAAAPPASAPPQTQRPEPAPVPAGAAAAAGPDDQGPSPLGPVQFEHLIMSLVSSAMYQLGMAARPGEPPPPADFPAAQETIDLLAVLEKKTQGNLTPEESQLLSGGLQELRLAFVELSRRAGRIR